MGNKPRAQRPGAVGARAPTSDSSRIASRFDRDPHKIAYDLWCLQENRRRDGQPLQPLAHLVEALRTQTPCLQDADIEPGIALFLHQVYAEVERAYVARHRYAFRNIPMAAKTQSSGGTPAAFDTGMPTRSWIARP